ncbi:MAG: DNA polymerase III subunit epsilon [Gammaproteobacteria bacterium]|nr:MAG: DNA polymerase III subunit epsilon [Gammaproteobacteria bacterium]
MREIILDTETTGLNPADGHRIVEIGAVEIIDRQITGNTYQQYINPQREIPIEAINIHGITDKRVKNEPIFDQIVDEFNNFIRDSTVIIHNAPFDVGFINNEYKLCQHNIQDIKEICKIKDSLVMAKRKHKGGGHSLDALCKKYSIENSHRTYHGALLDSTILAEVYLKLSGGQATIKMEQEQIQNNIQDTTFNANSSPVTLKVIRATADEMTQHQEIISSFQGR